jgi:chemotaxis protein CheX
MDLEQHILVATLEVFEKMILLEAHPRPARRGMTSHFEDHVSSMLGFSGDLTGMFYVHCPLPAARFITASLLGSDEICSPTEIRDALGEVANMVAGGLKHSLAAQGTRLDISIPTAVSGSSYSVNTLAGAQGVGLPFDLYDHRFLVEVRYRLTT